MGIEDPILDSMQKLARHSTSALDASDPAFVLDPELRPKTKHNEFFESSEAQIPTINLSPLRSREPRALARLVKEIGRAAEDWGFFLVVNHGVPLALINALETGAVEFFKMPLEEKNKIVRNIEQPLGYFHQELTKNTRDWKEVFDFVVRDSIRYPAPDGSPGNTIRNQWPAQPAGLRDACQKYAKAVEKLGFELLGLLSQSLGLPAEYFHKHFLNHTTSVRLNYYPPCPIPDRVLGVSRHKDPGALTVLVQDETGGLQVRRKDGQWIGVKPSREAFVINVGDLFQVWSNDKYQSIEHRVVVNGNKARLSFPMFFNPDLVTDAFPVPDLLDEKHPPKYTKYNYGNFRRKRSDGNFRQDGKNIQISDFAINR